jgi:hypothetical protein
MRDAAVVISSRSIMRLMCSPLVAEIPVDYEGRGAVVVSCVEPVAAISL